MLIIPAIDLMNGKIVRLFNGDINRATYYPFEPLEIAKEFESLSFKRLHIVDLDAAFGIGSNLNVIEKIAQNTTLECEVGGGIKSFYLASKLLNLGVKRLVIGSLPFKDKEEFDKILNTFASNVVIGIDVKDNIVKISGWVESTSVKIIDFLNQVRSWGIKEAIVTDISKDGTLSGVDEEFYRNLALQSKLKIIASGGVRNYDDIIRLKKIEPFGVVAIIMGKAIYEQTIQLNQIKGGMV